MSDPPKILSLPESIHRINLTRTFVYFWDIDETHGKVQERQCSGGLKGILTF